MLLKEITFKHSGTFKHWKLLEAKTYQEFPLLFLITHQLKNKTIEYESVPLNTDKNVIEFMHEDCSK